MKRFLQALGTIALCVAAFAMLAALAYGRMQFFEGLFPEVFK